MLAGYVAAIGMVLFNLSLAFALYSPALLWNAFLHPKFGSLIWMGSPIFIILGLLIGLVFGLSTPAAVRVEPTGVSMQWRRRVFLVEWSQWKRRSLPLGFFGAVTTYAPPSGPQALVAVAFSRSQARVVVRELRSRTGQLQASTR